MHWHGHFHDVFIALTQNVQSCVCVCVWSPKTNSPFVIVLLWNLSGHKLFTPGLVILFLIVHALHGDIFNWVVTVVTVDTNLSYLDLIQGHIHIGRVKPNLCVLMRLFIQSTSNFASHMWHPDWHWACMCSWETNNLFLKKNTHTKLSFSLMMLKLDCSNCAW